jgi:nitrite reductase/ring-hydroxylating ferredoxin subunit
MSRQAITLSTIFERPATAGLDRLAEPLQSGAHAIFNSSTVTLRLKSLLNGTPLRHRLHPAIVVVPLGAWTTAVLLDALEGRADRRTRAGLRHGADVALAFGILSALPAALSGLADWVDTNGTPRRLGVAHALVNSAGLATFGASLALRGAGARSAGKLLAGVGLGVVSLGGALGGELVFSLGVNVPYQPHPTPPDEFTDVLAGAELPEGQPRVVEAGEVKILLLRYEGEVLAVQEWCPHLGGPLSEGQFDGDIVECPWHQSRFCLRDGAPRQGPASVPLQTFEVREQAGRILVKANSPAG